MRRRTSPARRSSGRHVDLDGTDPHGIAPIPPDAGSDPIASDVAPGPVPSDAGRGPVPTEEVPGPIPTEAGPGFPADGIPGPRQADGLSAPRPRAWEHDPGRDDRWAPRPVPAAAGLPDHTPDPDGDPGGSGPGATQAARRWAGPGRATGPPGCPRPERPPRDGPPRDPLPRNPPPRNPPPRNPPPRDPLPRRRDDGPGIPPARRSWEDPAPAGPPDDPYGEQLYGYRGTAPDPFDGTGPGGTRYDEPRHEPRYDDPRYDDPRYDDPRYDDPPDDGPGSGGRAAGVPQEHAGWAETPGAPDADPEPEAPAAHRVRRPYGGRAAASRPGYRSAPPEPAPGDGATVPGPPIRLIAVPVAVGALVAVALGVWARQHEGTGVAVNLAGFSSGGAAKAWLGSLALLLALVQGVTGRMLHRGGGDALGTVHRWTGRAAVLVTVPVAVQCLYAFGWSGATTSALLHSLLGCVFYGAFVTKMLLLRRPGVPGWMLATCGGLLLAVLAGVWLTSALWFFTGHGLSF